MRKNCLFGVCTFLFVSASWMLQSQSTINVNAIFTRNSGGINKENLCWNKFIINSNFIWYYRWRMVIVSLKTLFGLVNVNWGAWCSRLLLMTSLKYCINKLFFFCSGGHKNPLLIEKKFFFFNSSSSDGIFCQLIIPFFSYYIQISPETFFPVYFRWLR